MATEQNQQNTAEFELKTNEFYLDHAKFIWDKIKLQRETTDRYFNYYLLLVTTPIIAFAAVTGKSSDNFDYQTIGLLCLFLYVLGTVFFCLYIRQRKNNLSLGKELSAVSKLLHDTTLFASLPKKEDGLIVNGILSDNSWMTADFWVSMIQMVINTFWIINAALFIDLDISVDFTEIRNTGAACWGAISVCAHIFGRDFSLYKSENRRPFAVTSFFITLLTRFKKQRFKTEEVSVSLTS